MIWFESTEVTTTGQGGISNWTDCMIIWAIWGLTSCVLSTVMLFHTQRRREPIRRPDYWVASASVLEGSKFNLPDLQRESQSGPDFCQISSISRLLKLAGFHESTRTSAHRGEVRGWRGNRWAQTENNKPPNDGKQPRAARTDAGTPADTWNTELRPTTQRVCKILDIVSAESDCWMWLIHLKECNGGIFEINISIHATPWRLLPDSFHSDSFAFQSYGT